MARQTLPTPQPHKVRTVYSLPKFPLVINREVNKEISHFREKDPRYIELAQKRGHEFSAMIKQVLRDEGVPAELSNVAMIESGFQPNIKSPAGAAGLWQFMQATAKYYGLRVNVFQDQRKDPILATIAASRLLRDLYLEY
ncbi:MAG: transglycosylase SLT domain-containing protein, partial [Bdellovibrionales bacterium]|nr:transglycosylase SLT domain-containing protein [Bdellovibrionales bacterium]